MHSGLNRQLRDGTTMTDPVLVDSGATDTPGTSERRGTKTTYLHSGLKNAFAQSGTSQTVTATREYDAFGNVTSSTGTWEGPFGYAGKFGYQSPSIPGVATPDAGITLMGHRYYDPTTGRFLTRDPIFDGRNWYSYGGGESNPLVTADPDGLKPRPGIDKPPVPVPGGGPNNDWKWIPNKNYNPKNPKSRPGKWVPKHPVKGQSQPSASWDRVHKHWDVDDGRKNRNRYTERGRFLPHTEAHKSAQRPVTGLGALAGKLAGIVGGIVMPSNLGAPRCTGMVHTSPMCEYCGHIP